MNPWARYWRVAQTYLYRPRFWFSGGAYLFFPTVWGDPLAWDVRQLASLLLAAILCCFVALHLRRQFGSPASKLLPHFAVVHLTVAMILVVAVCIVLPWQHARIVDMPVLPAVGLHAIAVILLSLVACWPSAIVLLVAIPTSTILLWSQKLDFTGLTAFLHGDYPLEAWGLIGLAAALQPLAGYRLLRLTDRASSVNDDFAIEELPREGPGGPWEQWMLAARDSTVERSLATGKERLGWSVERWRIPVASGWLQWITAALFVWGLMAISHLMSREPRRTDYALLVLVMSCGVMLFAPYGRWQSRRAAFGLEATRPVTRKRLVREMSAALAFDVASWMLLVTTIYIVGIAAFVGLPARGDPYAFFFNSLCVMWGTAALLYGIGLVVLRYRYWLPLMIGGLLAWFIVAWPVMMYVAPVVSLNRPRLSETIGGTLFFLGAGYSGYLLSRWAQRRWIEADFT